MTTAATLRAGEISFLRGSTSIQPVQYLIITAIALAAISAGALAILNLTTHTLNWSQTVTITLGTSSLAILAGLVCWVAFRCRKQSQQLPPPPPQLPPLIGSPNNPVQKPQHYVRRQEEQPLPPPVPALPIAVAAPIEEVVAPASPPLAEQPATPIAVAAEQIIPQRNNLNHLRPDVVSLPRLGAKMRVTAHDGKNFFGALNPVSVELQSILVIFFDCLKMEDCISTSLPQALANTDVIDVGWAIGLLRYSKWLFSNESHTINSHRDAFRTAVNAYAGRNISNIVSLILRLTVEKELQYAFGGGLADDASGTHPLVWADLIINSPPIPNLNIPPNPEEPYSFLSIAKKIYLAAQELIKKPENKVGKQTDDKFLSVLGYLTVLFSQSPKYLTFFRGFAEKTFKGDQEKVEEAVALTEYGKKVAEEKLDRFVELLHRIAENGVLPTRVDRQAFLEFLDENTAFAIAIVSTVTQAIEEKREDGNLIIKAMDRLVPGFCEALRKEVQKDKDAVFILDFLKTEKKAYAEDRTLVNQAKTQFNEQVKLPNEEEYLQVWATMIRYCLGLASDADRAFARKLIPLSPLPPSAQSPSTPPLEEEDVQGEVSQSYSPADSRVTESTPPQQESAAAGETPPLPSSAHSSTKPAPAPLQKSIEGLTEEQGQEVKTILNVIATEKAVASLSVSLPPLDFITYAYREDQATLKTIALTPRKLEKLANMLKNLPKQQIDLNILLSRLQASKPSDVKAFSIDGLSSKDRISSDCKSLIKRLFKKS